MTAHDCDPMRCEARDDVLHVVDYTRFARTDPDPNPRLGFTRDVSTSGMCLGVDDPEFTGALLWVAVRGLDSRPGPRAIHRVVWCSAERGGRYWLGLERVADRKLLARPESILESHDLSRA